MVSVFNTAQHKEALCECVVFEDSLPYFKEMNLLPAIKVVSLCLPKCFPLISLSCEFLILSSINTINCNCWFLQRVILISNAFIVLGAQTFLLCGFCFVPWESL